MRSTFVLISLWLIVGAGTGFSQQSQPDGKYDENNSFKEQQVQLNAQLIGYVQQQVNILNQMKDYLEKEQYDPAWDYLPETPQYQQQIRRNRGDDEFNYSMARLDNLRLKMVEAETKKNELKMKILNYNKQIPDWWDKTESEFTERRQQIVHSGLRR